MATSDISVHLSLSCNEPNGLDWLTQLWNLAVQDAAFRNVLPRPDGQSGEEALGHHLRHLYEHLGDIAFDPKGLQIAKNMRRGYGIKRGEYHLPDTGPLQGGEGQVVSAETPIEGRR